MLVEVCAANPANIRSVRRDRVSTRCQQTSPDDHGQPPTNADSLEVVISDNPVRDCPRVAVAVRFPRVSAAHNPEVAGSNPAPATKKCRSALDHRSCGRAAHLFVNRTSAVVRQSRMAAHDRGRRDLWVNSKEVDAHGANLPPSLSPLHSFAARRRERRPPHDRPARRLHPRRRRSYGCGQRASPTAH